MKFLRHILSHIFSITFFLVIVSVFYYRTLLLPPVVVDKVDGYISQLYSPILSFSSNRDYFWDRKTNKTVSFENLAVNDTADEIKDNEPAVTANNDVPVASAVPEVAEVIEQAEVQLASPDVVVPEKISEEEKVNKDIVETVTVNNSDQVNETTPETVAVQNKDQPAAVTEVKQAVSGYDMFVSARSAFNNGNMAQSEQSYLQLTELDQNNPDVYGELGNVYYSQGKWSEAGKAYYEAAVRLISKGNTNQVVYLQRVIEGLDVEYANKLSQLMMSK